MLKICLAFGKSERPYAYKGYAYKRNMYLWIRFLRIYSYLGVHSERERHEEII